MAQAGRQAVACGLAGRPRERGACNSIFFSPPAQGFSSRPAFRNSSRDIVNVVLVTGACYHLRAGDVPSCLIGAGRRRVGRNLFLPAAGPRNACGTTPTCSSPRPFAPVLNMPVGPTQVGPNVMLPRRCPRFIIYITSGSLNPDHMRASLSHATSSTRVCTPDPYIWPLRPPCLSYIYNTRLQAAGATSTSKQTAGVNRLDRHHATQASDAWPSQATAKHRSHHDIYRPRHHSTPLMRRRGWARSWPCR